MSYMLFWALIGAAVLLGVIVTCAVLFWVARPLRIRRNKRLIERYGSTLKGAKRGKER